MRIICTRFYGEGMTQLQLADKYKNVTGAGISHIT